MTVLAGDICWTCNREFVDGDEVAWNLRGKFHANCIQVLTDAYFFGTVHTEKPKDESVRLINLTISVCTPCLGGDVGECHTPGCAFWMQDAPNTELVAILLQNCRPSPLLEQAQRDQDNGW